MVEVRTELISELREKFFRELDNPSNPSANTQGFHPADIARVKENDGWLRRFLEHNQSNVQEAFDMLWQTCSWRKKFGANEITEDTVNRHYLEAGCFFSFGKDRDDKTMFVIKCKLHSKGSIEFEEIQKLVVYWFERLERYTNGDQISIFFDMMNTGISNIDMEFIRYLIDLCKHYYPNFLNYIIVFEMPWVLNSIFQVIKTWLPPEAISKIKSIRKSNIQEYVNPNDILIYWGGTNNYEFKFVPEVQNNLDATMNGKINSRKVHFAESSPLTEKSPTSFGDQIGEEKLLSVEPDAITFNKNGADIAGTITLKNTTADKPLSYKIKITSPEKFRVRPTKGVLLPLEECSISVVLQPGYDIRSLVHNEGFLIMCLPLKDGKMSARDLAAFWKSEQPTEQHRLGLRLLEDHDLYKPHSILSPRTAEYDKTMDTIFYKISQLRESNAKLQSDVTVLKYSVFFSIIATIVVAMMVVYILRTDIKNSLDNEACHIPHGI